MRQIHRAGEKLFIDFAGPTIGLTDGSRAHIFVAVAWLAAQAIAPQPGGTNFFIPRDQNGSSADIGSHWR